jgi:hypothetical protein
MCVGYCDVETVILLEEMIYIRVHIADARLDTKCIVMVVPLDYVSDMLLNVVQLSEL